MSKDSSAEVAPIEYDGEVAELQIEVVAVAIVKVAVMIEVATLTLKANMSKGSEAA